MRKKTMHYAICGLDYVYLEDVPICKTKHGDAIAANLSVIEWNIAGEIVRQGIPLRGAEVQFLRKSIGASMAKFGSLLGLSAPAIFKWERARTRRLAPINEVAVRALMAEKLGVELNGRFTELKGIGETPEKLSIPIGDDMGIKVAGSRSV